MDLEPFRRINPCGYAGLAVTTMLDLGGPGSPDAVKPALVGHLAEQFGRLLDKPVRCKGTEGDTALLSDGQLGHRRYGSPRVDASQLMRWIAHWVRRGGPTLDRPTHFEVRDGGF